MSSSGTRIARTLAHMSAAPCSAAPPATAAAVKAPLKVVVTGAAGNIAYAIVFHIGAGRMLGADQPIDLCLLDIAPMADKMNGVMMEINDCAFALLNSVTVTTDYQTAFTNADVALLIGARPRGPGMVRADLLTANAKIFAGQGKALNQFANRNVKVVVVGNPANTNALITSVNAPNIPQENITALTRLDQNRAEAQIAEKIGVNVSAVSNIVIWGNHSKTQYPDVNHAVLRRGDAVLPVRSVVNDDNWIRGPFMKTVQERGAAIIQARKLSSAASAANAVIDHVHDWFLGTPAGVYASMAVPSDGSYGIPTGIVYSFPVICSNGQYQIVQGLAIDEFSRKCMDETAAELLEEKKMALAM